MMYNIIMRKIGLVLTVLLTTFFVSPVKAADTNNFYFDDFTADYYLTKDQDNISHLKVRESVTAVFPTYNQNKGICRQIPFTNQGGKNVTLPKLTKDGLKLTRNGNSEPIYSIETSKKGSDKYYNVCTGNDDYVLGRQTYVFEYEFSRVVTEFKEKGKVFQELYWDTNGNGALQKFNKVTARLHFEDKNVWSGESSCYVGKLKEKGMDRCKTTLISDGLEFSAENLAKFENLTFDVELKPGSFAVPEPYTPPLEKNYFYVWAAVGVGVLCLLAIGLEFRKFMKTREKAHYYKSIFVKPEYQPHKDYSLPEMADLFIGKKKDMKVGMMLELVVNKKIEFQKADGKKWNIFVKDLTGVREEYLDLLSILNGGTRPKEGDTINLKRQVATSSLIALRKSEEAKLVSDLKKDKLVEEKYHFGSNNAGSSVLNAIILSIIFVPIVLMVGLFVITVLEELVVGQGVSDYQDFVFYEHFYTLTIAMVIVTTIITVLLSDAASKYERHTKKGLEASRYMDGLKLYIEMAEADRLKMLQSVKGADVSAEGIVKLYEKLLPYAAIFGLEESWMKEMREYCELQEITQPDYLMTGIAISDFSRGLNMASSYVSTASTMSSSGGASSSGFSGR